VNICEGCKKVSTYYVHEMSRDSCRDKFKNESNYPHCFESLLSVQKTARVALLILNPRLKLSFIHVNTFSLL
jgi:hypothetical protein